MGERAELLSGMTLRDIADAAGSTHTRVRNLAMRGLIPYDEDVRRGIPRDLGTLLATVIRGDAASTVTADLMRTDPGRVLESALALAELARRRLQSSSPLSVEQNAA